MRRPSISGAVAGAQVFNEHLAVSHGETGVLPRNCGVVQQDLRRRAATDDHGPAGRKGGELRLLAAEGNEHKTCCIATEGLCEAELVGALDGKRARR
jgi:hypothetical protein